MGAENFVTNGVGGKRAARRARVLLAAKLQTAAGELDCRLRDVSRKGALVECTTPLTVGSDVTFVRGSTLVPARIAWAAAGRIGLEFHFTIDEQEMLVQLKRKTGRESSDRFRRPGFNEAMPEDALKLAKQWGITVGLTVPTD